MSTSVFISQYISTGKPEIFLYRLVMRYCAACWVGGLPLAAIKINICSKLFFSQVRRVTSVSAEPESWVKRKDPDPTKVILAYESHIQGPLVSKHKSLWLCCDVSMGLPSPLVKPPLQRRGGIQPRLSPQGGCWRTGQDGGRWERICMFGVSIKQLYGW